MQWKRHRGAAARSSSNRSIRRRGRHRVGARPHVEESEGFDVAEAFSKLVEMTASADDPKTLLTQLAGFCASSLGRDISATVAMGPPGAPSAVGSTHALAQELDGAMLITGEGPSHDAWENFSARSTSENARADDR